jgi:hypothetical protein
MHIPSASEALSHDEDHTQDDPPPAAVAIIINLSQGVFDGIYTADNPAKIAKSVAAWREQFPGDLIVTAQLLEWPDGQWFSHRVRWMHGRT